MPVVETYFGYIETTKDSLLVFEACRQGVLPRVQRRLQDQERHLIKSGAVFCFDGKESGIKRWTDGLVWSPSRILGNFLIYRELDDRQDDHAVEDPVSTPQSITSGLTLLSKRQRERSLVGSLRSSYRFKPNGLIKKSMSLVVNGVQQHLISYYTKDDILHQRFNTPCSLPELAAIEISPELIRGQNFRIPFYLDGSNEDKQNELPAASKKHNTKPRRKRQASNQPKRRDSLTQYSASPYVLMATTNLPASPSSNPPTSLVPDTSLVLPLPSSPQFHLSTRASPSVQYLPPPHPQQPFPSSFGQPPTYPYAISSTLMSSPSNHSSPASLAIQELTCHDATSSSSSSIADHHAHSHPYDTSDYGYTVSNFDSLPAPNQDHASQPHQPDHPQEPHPSHPLSAGQQPSHPDFHQEAIDDMPHSSCGVGSVYHHTWAPRSFTTGFSLDRFEQNPHQHLFSSTSFHAINHASLASRNELIGNAFMLDPDTLLGSGWNDFEMQM
ncbi:hypothetical protein DM01DRAFT_1300040 [Hesseltinella vesiculosa]|uniref:Gti1/Pac2 family-domain-containing protein n=1 Tax=Hesseltinella vesiculosa TaxID=101127 RepID=A0A1X2GRY9_9FUNG|nr:hypothetical protein DM01DRAFT_1300040 [Hesseltinella vesiculosa]